MEGEKRQQQKGKQPRGKPQQQKQAPRKGEPRQQNPAAQKPQPKKPAENPPPAPPAKPAEESVGLFSYLPVVRKWTSKELREKLAGPERVHIHPALFEFALQTAPDISLGGDELTIIFLRMMARQIRDEPLDEKMCGQQLYSLLNQTAELLSIIRVTPIGVDNAMRFIKHQLSVLFRIHEEPEKLRSVMLSAIDQFIEEKIEDVANFLARTTADTIVDDDVVLTYGWSPVICKALNIAASRGRKFRVTVVDSRPNFDARRLVSELSPGINVSYVLISGLSYVMPGVTKVIIEPCGILSNNAAQTRVGTSLIAMVAHECGVPVIFVCPSYRFATDAMIDALLKNEVISRELLTPVPRGGVQESQEYLALTYDVTPGEYVDIVICELGNVPVNSISTNIRLIHDTYTFSRPRTRE